MSRKIQEVKDSLALEKQIKQNLIAQSNATTGNEDTTLTNAVNSLVEGFRQGGSDHTQEDALITKNITEYSNDRVTYVGGYVFYECINLTRVSFPNVTKVGGYAFGKCSSLSEVYLPNAGYGTTNALGGRAFQDCTSLKSISLPKCSKITSASPHIFANCTSLENIDLPLLDSIGASRTFSGCTSLTNIKLQSVRTINTTLTFENCTNLIALILPYESAVVALGNTNNFTNTPIAKGTGYIYVPKALIEEYKAATNWSIFADQFREIEDYLEICGGETE